MLCCHSLAGYTLSGDIQSVTVKGELSYRIYLAIRRGGGLQTTKSVL